MNITGNVFLVTGGSSGLGAACVRRIVEGGGQVILADIDLAAGDELAAALGPAASCVATDVTDPAQVQAAIDAAARRGPLRGVVHCAGILAAARIVGRDGPHDLALFRQVVEVNLVGTFNVMRLAAAMMAEQPPVDEGERGVIVTTSSVSAHDGQIGQAAYSASKGGVAALTLPAARELARHGIRVVAIAPGLFSTPMVEALPLEARESLVSQVPFPSRLGRPEEFAALAMHVVQNTMLNGTLIRLDGALRMGPK
jgi:NAD(P)-dependent dehydrogenase (short-subunit alcohol dehydrogenase family)